MVLFRPILTAALLVSVMIFSGCASSSKEEETQRASYGEKIKAVMTSKKADFQACRATQLKKKAPLPVGKVEAKFVIGLDGKVMDAGIKDTTLKNPPVERCILGIIEKLEFPAPADGEPVDVTYPFICSNS